jgi:hypothetical protein
VTTSLAADVREYDWRVKQDTRELLTVPIIDDSGDPFLLDGWVVDAKIKDRPGGVVLYTWPEVDIYIDEDKVSLLIPAPVSRAWLWRAGWYRLKLVDPASSLTDPAISRVLQGAISIDLD